MNSELMDDVYDGRMWSNFQCPNRQNFLAAPYSLATMLNLDWFQPFTHVKYSVGALYMVILNLPREERYKLEKYNSGGCYSRSQRAQENCKLISSSINSRTS